MTQKKQILAAMSIFLCMIFIDETGVVVTSLFALLSFGFAVFRLK